MPQGLLYVGNNIFAVLKADGQTNKLFANAGFAKLIRRQLAVCGGRRVASQRTRIADVDQPQNEFELINETHTRFQPALNAKAENA